MRMKNGEKKFEVDAVLLAYLDVYKLKEGIPFSFGVCNQIYNTLGGLNIEKLILEHATIESIYPNMGLDSLLLLCFDPFDSIIPSPGKEELVWYEKFVMIFTMNYIRCLTLHGDSYSLPTTTIYKGFPSLSMLCSLEKDTDFCFKVFPHLSVSTTFFFWMESALPQNLKEVIFK